MATVDIQDATKSFGSTRVIRGVSIDIRDGEFVVLVGPSGCGKSTLLRMIAGLEGIDAGEIRIGGRRVNGLLPKERDIAMVFQNYALYPHLTVADNLAFSLKLRHAPQQEIEQRVARAAKILGLEPLLARLPKQLSGGQRQRVAMGRAIVRDPQVFLFDEPLSNLDAKLRVAMRAEIRELHQRLKATTIYVTHDQIEAMTMADKIVAMHDGVVEQVGTPLELFDRPRNVFVAAFIGSPSMNLLPVKVSDQGVVDNAGNHWAVPGVSATSGQALTLGVRPEHLRLDGAGVEARVVVVESTGSETHLVVDAGGTKLTCVLRERVSVRPGDHVRLGADTAHWHLFRADSGERLEPVH
ncbi:sn-glycerol-3-phosphate ABC transporter ATP-binding protein UgpC [Variovorax guangxiensis]|uniref:ABC transporter ATP-binding protein n=1 Tax=Variovorax guangxiensis TaxID=1775474 RepID=UPI0028545DFC|nr:sn-glycerol-3-phosphate ABC transporter ATP-binding protein UgpC [Variovorax guangxiensis]MDR6860759.1 multiple sugar transport system ATP-binding protein [Variovorax guangxiensis]